MGLFDRRAAKGTPFEWLVVGLGNPGSEFTGTRHNLGEEVVRLLADRRADTLKAGKNNALVAESRIGETRVVLAFPITYMNESGLAVSSLIRRYKIDDPARVVIVHDELDLAPGTVRVKVGGGLAGHNGLRSVAQHLRTQDFVRVRLGVGKPQSKEHGRNHVLSRVSKRDRELFDESVIVAADAVETIVTAGADAAMRAVNGR